MANLNQVFPFAFTKTTQHFNAEKDHVYYLECYGAGGGNGGGDRASVNSSIGGKGGFAKGYYLSLNKEIWNVEVGGMGLDGKEKYGGEGGYHLGGKGGDDTDSSDFESGGGGGGATTINKLLTGGGGSGGGSPNTQLRGQDVTQLHTDGKGCGGSGGKGYGGSASAYGESGGLVEGGTPPTPTTNNVPAEPGKNYLGKELMYATHGTCDTRDNGSAKITCVAKPPELHWLSLINDTLSFYLNFNNVISVQSISKYLHYKIGDSEWKLMHSSDSPENTGRIWEIKVPVGFKDLIRVKANNGFVTEELVLDFKAPVVTFSPNFSNLTWVQNSPLTDVFTGTDDTDKELEYDIEYYINGKLHSSVLSTKNTVITPPLLYSAITPQFGNYELFLRVRAKQDTLINYGLLEDIWSDWITSPTVRVTYELPPSDINFEFGLLPYYLVGENTLIEWTPSEDPNGTPVTYNATLVKDDNIMARYNDLTEPHLNLNMPNEISSNVSIGVEAKSQGKFSNPIITQPFAITDVNITDCTLEFPRITTNITGEFREIRIQINGDTRIKGKTENLTNFELPIFYFKRGLNKVRLIALDRNNVEIDRTWEVNLTFDESTLELQPTMNIKNYMSFNSQGTENYASCTELAKSILDLGKTETTVVGSSSEGANSITQKLVVNRKKNDDTTQLRILQITGAID